MIERYRRELSVAVAYSLMLLFLAVCAPAVLPADALRALVVSNAPVLVAAVGMTLVILCRQIDISVGSQSSASAAWLPGCWRRPGCRSPLVALGTLLAGAGLGAVNGVLVAGLGLPSIVVTLATLVIGRESLRYVREGEFVRDLPRDVPVVRRRAGDRAVGGRGVARRGLRRVRVGPAKPGGGSGGLRDRLGPRGRPARRHPAATRRVRRLRRRWGPWPAWLPCSNAVRFADVDPNAGNGLEMQVIAAVVVGGTAVSGGRGTLLGHA